jgi:hypothetical protein
MADSTVNDPIIDAITQIDIATLGLSPAVAATILYQGVAQAASNAAGNGTTAQQQVNILAQAVTTTGVTLVYAQAK